MINLQFQDRVSQIIMHTHDDREAVYQRFSFAPTTKSTEFVDNLRDEHAPQEKVQDHPGRNHLT